jgi:EAL domain-containing protein (putative c-di-GMP-specific phosphodiesterase class I)
MNELSLSSDAEGLNPPDGARTGASPLLPNRELLLREIQAMRQRPLAEDEAFLIVVNIADTKAYDDIIRIFGYKFADNILGIRLETLDFLAAQATLYQVGFWSVGLIFVPRKSETLDGFLNTLVENLANPIICRGIPIPMKAGVGVCDLKKGLGSTEDLLQSTYIAGQAACMTSSGWSVCNYELADDHRRAFSLIADIGYSLTQANEFELCYQPRMDLRSSRCIGAEALLRWQHPYLGPVTPNEFIPLVEMTGLMRELTDWVLSRAIYQIGRWQAEGVDIKISANISVRNLEEPDFVRRLQAMLDYAGLTSRHLELELSESRMFVDPYTARNTLDALRQMGIGISVDDFGTGPNSFAYLQNTPANIMKIDQSLIFAMKDNLRNQIVVKSMIGMAHDLSMEVVAEGVETHETLAMLAKWGCNCAQGYFLSRPMYADEFSAWYLRNFPAGGKG